VQMLTRVCLRERPYRLQGTPPYLSLSIMMFALLLDSHPRGILSLLMTRRVCIGAKKLCHSHAQSGGKIALRTIGQFSEKINTAGDFAAYDRKNTGAAVSTTHCRQSRNDVCRECAEHEIAGRNMRNAPPIITVSC